ncbi:MAG: UDP-4-amino-4,6-dideoxy-N-acetyl-beta-L-altrosamine N-acetyltransferase [Chloroflexi bacterium]|nr:UDP-4-amino-4,6-dideoxy-N-acetyl-beta-L-altrosamine N-acetyltransferase [Chloroflexota bacterium]
MISLRELREEDKDKIRNWRNKPEIARYMYTEHVISEQEHDRWFARITSDPTCHYWIIAVDDRDVGLVNIYDLDLRNKRCYWAFYVAEEGLRGRGVGSFVEYAILSYVFEQIGLEKLCCEVLAFNEPVVEMHKKFGFQVEGKFRSHIWKDGQFVDVFSLGIMRREWESEQARLETDLRQKGIMP